MNLFIFDLPRLSVDVDLNYVGSASVEDMKAERPQMGKAVEAVCGREGLDIGRIPTGHVGGKYALRYESALGQGADQIPVVELHELAAGKLAALLSRHAARDLFDVHKLLTQGQLEPERLRLAFVVFGAVQRKDWRTVSAEDVGFEPKELERSLGPFLQATVPEIGPRTRNWAARLVEECRQAFGAVLPFTFKGRP